MSLIPPTIYSDTTNTYARIGNLYSTNRIGKIFSPWRLPAYVATTENTDLSGLQTIDGIVLTENLRILVKSQLNTVENGIYSTRVDKWIRTQDCEIGQDISGIVVYVSNGNTNKNIYYFNSLNSVVGTDPIEFIPFSETGDITPGGVNDSIQYKVGNVYTGNSTLTTNGGGDVGVPAINLKFDTLSVGENTNPYTDDYSNESLTIDGGAYFEDDISDIVKTGSVDVDDFNVAGGDITFNKGSYETGQNVCKLFCDQFTCGTSNNVNGNDGVIFNEDTSLRALTVNSDSRNISLSRISFVVNSSSFNLPRSNCTITIDIGVLGTIPPLGSITFTVSSSITSPVVKAIIRNYIGGGYPYITNYTDNTNVFSLVLHNLDISMSISSDVIVDIIII
jgi:hypothetical protein